VRLRTRSINYKAVSERIRGVVARVDGSEKWFPSFMVARRLGMESSTLGRLTGACRIAVRDKSYDVGLGIRHGQEMSVPEFARPAAEGVPTSLVLAFSAARR
jgi:hypothetical protein